MIKKTGLLGVGVAVGLVMGAPLASATDHQAPGGCSTQANGGTVRGGDGGDGTTTVGGASTGPTALGGVGGPAAGGLGGAPMFNCTSIVTINN